MSRFRLFMWVITALFLGECSRRKLQSEEGFFKKLDSGELPEKIFSTPFSSSVWDVFDSRSGWPHCLSIGQISDQGSSDSSWAVSAADAMTDRICIHSLGEHKYRLSAANLINCCVKCVDNSGMNMAKIPGSFSGGSHAEAWKYWIKNGIVTGGPYGSDEGCQPYEFEPCKHFTNDLNTTIMSRQTCKIIYHTRNCRHSCQPLNKNSYYMDKNYGKEAYRIKRDELAIRTEILLNGPVQASMQLFDDFKNHKSGLYYHNNGSYSHMHTVRIIGWGHDNKTNTPYWLVANSYGTDWGENGFFRIIRGVNECLIESNVTAGIPDYQPSLTIHRVMYKSQDILNAFWEKIRTYSYT